MRPDGEPINGRARARELAERSESVLPAIRILLADDHPDVLAALRLLFKREGIQIDAATSPALALAALESQEYDLLVMDLNYDRDTTSGREGMELLARIQLLDPTLPVIVLTGWPTVDLAVESMRGGAADFVLKPWDNAKLLSAAMAQIEKGRQLRTQRLRESESERELAEAREIQRDFVPLRIPVLSEFRFAASYHPAGELSGDYFDVLSLGEGRLGICIADVVGKGLPAALLMSSVQAVVKGFAPIHRSPGELCFALNSLVAGIMATNRFITFFYAVLDTRHHSLRYCNAGHNPPLLVHADGSFARLQEGGGVLGVEGAWGYGDAEIGLAPGDRLLLFTDGLTEARNGAGEEFGERRLVDLMVAHQDLEPERLKDEIMQAVGRFGSGSLRDDATLVVMAVG